MMDLYSGAGDLDHREGCFDYKEFVRFMFEAESKLIKKDIHDHGKDGHAH